MDGCGFRKVEVYNGSLIVGYVHMLNRMKLMGKGEVGTVKGAK